MPIDRVSNRLPDAAIPDAGDRTLGFANPAENGRRSSWQPLAAVYASVPLAAIGFWYPE